MLKLARECRRFGVSDFFRTHVKHASLSNLYFLLEIPLELKLFNFPEQTLTMCFRVERGVQGVAL